MMKSTSKDSSTFVVVPAGHAEGWSSARGAFKLTRRHTPAMPFSWLSEWKLINSLLTEGKCKMMSASRNHRTFVVVPAGHPEGFCRSLVAVEKHKHGILQLLKTSTTDRRKTYDDIY